MWKLPVFSAYSFIISSFQKNLIVWKPTIILNFPRNVSKFQKNLIVWKLISTASGSSFSIVSEELNSVETLYQGRICCGIPDGFQKNLIVWKLECCPECAYYAFRVSEELNSVETKSFAGTSRTTSCTVSEELNSVETSESDESITLAKRFQKNLIVWKRDSFVSSFFKSSSFRRT